MRSCDRDASLARALIKVLMTLGAGQTVPVGGADEVISNSTASSASKQEVMRLTEQRESHDTERYSPSTHTWETNKLSAVSASGFEQMLKCEKHWVFAHNPRYTEESALSLPHVYRVPLCCRRWLCFQQTPAARGTGSRPERGGAYIASTGGSWTPCRNSEKWLERVSEEMKMRVRQAAALWCFGVPVYLFDVRRDVKEQAASLQHHQNQMSQKLLVSDLKETRDIFF